MARMRWAQKTGVSPDFLLLSTNNTKLAEKREGHEGVGTSHCQVASDLLQLAQAGLQFSCYVVYRKRKRYKPSESAACLVYKLPHSWQTNCPLLFLFSVLGSSLSFKLQSSFIYKSQIKWLTYLTCFYSYFLDQIKNIQAQKLQIIWKSSTALYFRNLCI